MMFLAGFLTGILAGSLMTLVIVGLFAALIAGHEASQKEWKD